jgi:hypothetical protein
MTCGTSDRGYRWHVRAFCHEERSYKDFVIGRISATRELGEPATTVRGDLEWVEIKRIHLVAQPGISPSELRALQLDFGLKGSDSKCQSEPLSLSIFYDK